MGYLSKAGFHGTDTFSTGAGTSSDSSTDCRKSNAGFANLASVALSSLLISH
jgi:hypothetical protein